MSQQPTTTDGSIASNRSSSGQTEQLMNKLQRGLALHQQGDFQQALQLCEEVLSLQPCNASALNLAGLACQQQGEKRRAERLIARAIVVDPHYADAYNNLATVYAELGLRIEAVACLRRALNLRPDFLSALTNLATLYRHLSMDDEMLQVTQRIIELQPENFEAHFNIGMLQFQRERPDLAIAPLRRAVQIDPDSRACYQLGMAFYTMGDQASARQVFSDWLLAHPGQAIASHMLAALTGEAMDVPARAADEYVSALFDGFAESFDEVLGGLDYQGPALIRQVLASLYPDRQPVLDILDAGCGTGLCGPELEPFSRSLTGVDLSRRMLQRAAQVGCYSELHEAEITAYLQSCERSYDAIVCVDTLIYFGDLYALFNVAYHRLRPGGRLLFTTEQSAQTDRDYELGSAGRYAHREGYLLRVLASAGFIAVESSSVKLRHEVSQAVAGILISTQKPAH